jgi:hypothetical protein
VSVAHGHIIEKIGYHVRDYFHLQKERFKDIPGGVMAHSTHVKGIGSFIDGVEYPRIKVTLATQIPEEICKKINLGYCNPNAIRSEEWQHKEDQGNFVSTKKGIKIRGTLYGYKI